MPTINMGRAMTAACSLVDPFCQDSVGVRIPDGNTAPTFPYHLDSVANIVTDAAGAACYWVTPDAQYNYINSTIAAGTATTPAAWISSSSGMQTFVGANVVASRIVSFGVEFIPTMTPMTASGFYVLNEVSGGINVSTGYASLSLDNPTNYVGACRDGSVSWLSRPTEPVRSFVAQRGSSSVSSSNWTSLKIAVSGAPVSQTIGQIRIIGNFEAEFSAANTTGASAQKVESAPALLTVVDKMRSNLDPYIQGSRLAVERKVASAASAALKIVARSAMNYMTSGMSEMVIGGSRTIMNVD